MMGFVRSSRYRCRTFRIIETKNGLCSEFGAFDCLRGRDQGYSRGRAGLGTAQWRGGLPLRQRTTVSAARGTTTVVLPELVATINVVLAGAGGVLQQTESIELKSTILMR